MTECPSCRTSYEGRPRFCGTCGYQFASAPSTPDLKKCPDCAEDIRAEARKCRFCGFEFPPEPIEESQVPERPEMKTRWKGLIALALLLCVLIWGAYVKSVDHATSSVTSNAGSSARPAPPESADGAGIGETVTVARGMQSNGTEGFWPCGSTTEAFDELMKWAVRGDNAEVKRTMRTTRSFALEGGMKVKILDIGFGKRKVRVLTNSAGEASLKDEQGVFSADVRIGRECWVVSEALTR